MIARLQRTTVLLLLAVSLLWLAVRVSAGDWVGGLVGAVLLFNIQPLVLAFEFFVLVPWINRRDPAPRPGWPRLFRAWLVESATAHAVFSWRQPFHARRHDDTIDHPNAEGCRPVVLVHGFLCNRGLWNPWVARLRRHRVPFVAVNLEPPFTGIDDYASAIDAAVRRARDATGQAPVLVGHSMGGLAIRAWWRTRGDEAATLVSHVVTVGSPHAGTFTARFARAANARQMGLAHPWLQSLAQSESAAQRARFTCFYSHCDNVVMPASTAALDGADNRHLPGQPHVALIYAPPVIDEVLRRAGARPLSSG